jgi:transposase, IS30 family
MSRSSLSEAERTEIWVRRRTGESMLAVARHMGKGAELVRRYVVEHGGFPPRIRRRSALHLSVAEREEISRGLARGLSCHLIALVIGRSPSTVSREVARNRGRTGYRAGHADLAAGRRARRPKSAKLASTTRLRSEVETKLQHNWSPQQISSWLKLEFPDDLEMRVSHETIYLSLFVQSRGALRKELSAHLRTRRTMRQPSRKVHDESVGGRVTEKILIRERPASVEDRAVPGHWEGDLVFGTKTNAIGTLVERTSRYVLLFALPYGLSADRVREALTASITTLPDALRLSLTWDQGSEMAQHPRFTVDTGVAVYFCDPRSPWQRGSNENTNGLLRQYFPKGKSLAGVPQAELDRVAAELNGRPRQTLGWLSPAQRFAQLAVGAA